MKLSPMDIQVTDKALTELRRIGAGGEQFLRVSVVPGGCSGMTYTAAIDNTLKEGDEVIVEQDDLRIIADSSSLLFLDGLRIDFSDDLVQAGFRFTNPNASKSCGCGSSFSV